MGKKIPTEIIRPLTFDKKEDFYQGNFFESQRFDELEGYRQIKVTSLKRAYFENGKLLYKKLNTTPFWIPIRVVDENLTNRFSHRNVKLQRHYEFCNGIQLISEKMQSFVKQLDGDNIPLGFASHLPALSVMGLESITSRDLPNPKGKYYEIYKEFIESKKTALDEFYNEFYEGALALHSYIYPEKELSNEGKEKIKKMVFPNIYGTPNR